MRFAPPQEKTLSYGPAKMKGSVVCFWSKKSATHISRETIIENNQTKLLKVPRWIGHTTLQIEVLISIEQILLLLYLKNVELNSEESLHHRKIII